MIKVTVDASGLDKLFASLTANVAAVVANRVRSVVLYVDEGLHSRTPVWTGAALRNMVWKMDDESPSSVAAIAEPAETGHTSQMAIGAEPRRAANEEAARETVGVLTYDPPWHHYVLANAASDIEIIEDGTSGLPGKTRAPAGVFAVTVADVQARLDAGVL